MSNRIRTPYLKIVKYLSTRETFQQTSQQYLNTYYDVGYETTQGTLLYLNGHGTSIYLWNVGTLLQRQLGVITQKAIILLPQKLQIPTLMPTLENSNYNSWMNSVFVVYMFTALSINISVSAWNTETKKTWILSCPSTSFTIYHSR